MTHRKLSSRQVRELCGGVSDMTIWRWMRQRDFPRPTKIASRNYWSEREIAEWWQRQAEAAAA